MEEDYKALSGWTCFNLVAQGCGRGGLLLQVDFDKRLECF